jgi:hypothetical protein
MRYAAGSCSFHELSTGVTELTAIELILELASSNPVDGIFSYTRSVDLVRVRSCGEE